jgi:hypothetical protein
MAKHAPQFPQQDFDPDFDADAPKYLEPAPEQPEEWDEEEAVDLGWSQINVDPSTFVTFEAQTPVEPLGIDYWLENTPVDRETATDIVEEVKKRHSENWGTKRLAIRRQCLIPTGTITLYFDHKGHGFALIFNQ